ncbi:hypothetical protein [Brevundimonas balnearis]|uniref:Uncharacterized protein n=1 Tax=Brevundimonas balnearis TaxID=1572858 RepID=A0ABV6QZF2_9CAUL
MIDQHDPTPSGDTDQYAVVAEPVWELARRDYLAGLSSSEVCERYGLARSTLHARAAREGWRRKDQPPRTVTPFIHVTGDLAEATFFDLSEMAVLRLRQSILSGRAKEAAGWLAMIRELRSESFTHDPPLTDELDSLDSLDRSSAGPAQAAQP